MHPSLPDHSEHVDGVLGRHVDYPNGYDAGLLVPIERAPARAALGLGDALPFTGVDRWHAYELGWLDARGLPRVGTATLEVPADSPRLVESKSLKLYLNGFNATRVASEQALLATITDDLSRAAGARVVVHAGLPPIDDGAGPAVSIDDQPLEIDHYGPPDAALLSADIGTQVEETLTCALLKSNCPVTAQPDWARLTVAYAGPRIDRAGLLRYIVSFRDHCEFHEQCVERVFVDLMARCAPARLSVEARYTRRGGLDINPWRATPGTPRPTWGRDERQ